MRRGPIVALAGVLALAAVVMVLGTSPEPPPPREDEVLEGLIESFVLPLGDIVVVSQPSDCRTAGVTKVAVAASLFGRFLDANAHPAEPADLSTYARRIRLGDNHLAPRVQHARSSKPVVSISRAGLTATEALICVEVYARQERAFFVLLRRDGDVWRVRDEIEVWRSVEPEEIPG